MAEENITLTPEQFKALFGSSEQDDNQFSVPDISSPKSSVPGSLSPLTPPQIQRQNTQRTLDPIGARQVSDVFRGAEAGTAFSQPTGDADLFTLGNVLQVGAGTAAGFAAGGIYGAAAGFVVSGLSAFLNSQSEKRRVREIRKLQASATKSRREQIAREERWKRIDRSDSLEQVRHNRKQAALQSQWSTFQAMNNQFISLLNNNQSLRERFARLGF